MPIFNEDSNENGYVIYMLRIPNKLFWYSGCHNIACSERAAAMVSVLRNSRAVMNVGWLIHLLTVCFNGLF